MSLLSMLLYLLCLLHVVFTWQICHPSNNPNFNFKLEFMPKPDIEIFRLPSTSNSNGFMPLKDNVLFSNNQYSNSNSNCKNCFAPIKDVMPKVGDTSTVIPPPLYYKPYDFDNTTSSDQLSQPNISVPIDTVTPTSGEMKNQQKSSSTSSSASDSKGLSTGMIIGIVLACTAVVGIVGFFGYKLYTKKHAEGATPNDGELPDDDFMSDFAAM